MSILRKLKPFFVLALCLPFCGAWTAALAEPEPEEPLYNNETLISTYAVEYLEYNSKTLIENIQTDNRVPEFSTFSGLTNGCGAVAGGTIVAFYDKYYYNMMPDWDSYFANGSYKMQDRDHANPMMLDLYSRMKISASKGVTETNFKNGLKEYMYDKGYEVSYNPIWNNGIPKYNILREAIKKNQVGVIFVKPSNLYKLSSEEGRDVYYSTYIPDNHIMVVYGYYEIEYITDTGMRRDKFLKVASGLGGISTYLYMVGSYVDAAYVVEIL